MLEHLIKALPHLIQVQKHYRRALSKFHYPTMHEDINHAIRDVKVLIAALERGERVPR